MPASLARFGRFGRFRTRPLGLSSTVQSPPSEPPVEFAAEFWRQETEASIGDQRHLFNRPDAIGRRVARQGERSPAPKTKLGVWLARAALFLALAGRGGTGGALGCLDAPSETHNMNGACAVWNQKFENFGYCRGPLKIRVQTYLFSGEGPILTALWLLRFLYEDFQALGWT